ncbi:MAG: bifunctional 2-polyprenyl-6-hydroxyphenol methylase/3-demethylubiquinol 3-O-methyltransferase UbiG [Gammaproteobacteria bacterium]
MQQNIDQHEVSKFNALASRWWDKNSDFKPLHDINPLRLEYINQHAPLSGKKVLDVGCGGGILAEGLASFNAKVTGIDMADASLNVAQLHLLESGFEIEYILITAEDLASQQSEKFDIVTCMELLEHVPDPASLINACSSLMKPGGDIFFSTLNRNPKSYLAAVIGAEYVLKMLPKGTHDYAKFIKPSELELWTRQAGLLIDDLTGMEYNPITKAYSLGPNIDINYLVHATNSAE